MAEPQFIDTGGCDDNVPLERLAQDSDPRFRPVPALVAAVTRDGYGSLDRPVVPLLNALQQRGIRTLESCAGGMLFADGIDERAVAAFEAVRRPWMQMRWAAGVEREGDQGRTINTARLELWWSRRIPNWGGYMGTDADWRWRVRTRSRRCVDTALLTMARQVADVSLPEFAVVGAEGEWLGALAGTLLDDKAVLGEKEWFEVVLSRDAGGWNVTARREYLPLGSHSARTLGALRRRIDAAPRRLVTGEGTEGLAELRLAMAAATGKQRWSQLDVERRRALLAVYAVPPSEHGRRGVSRDEQSCGGGGQGLPDGAEAM